MNHMKPQPSLQSGCSRRHFLLQGAAALAGASLFSACRTTAQLHGPRYKIALSDLMILKRQKLGAFQLTKDLGADGVEVDMGGLGERETFDNQLAKPEAVSV